MTLPDFDIWRAANLLIEQHGEDAERVAMRRVEDMNEENDLEGFMVWSRIRRAVATLQERPEKPN